MEVIECETGSVITNTSQHKLARWTVQIIVDRAIAFDVEMLAM